MPNFILSFTLLFFSLNLAAQELNSQQYQTEFNKTKSRFYLMSDEAKKENFFKSDGVTWVQIDAFRYFMNHTELRKMKFSNFKFPSGKFDLEKKKTFDMHEMAKVVDFDSISKKDSNEERAFLRASFNKYCIEYVKEYEEEVAQLYAISAGDLNYEVYCELFNSVVKKIKKYKHDTFFEVPNPFFLDYLDQATFNLHQSGLPNMIKKVSTVEAELKSVKRQNKLFIIFLVALSLFNIAVLFRLIKNKNK